MQRARRADLASLAVNDPRVCWPVVGSDPGNHVGRDILCLCWLLPHLLFRDTHPLSHPTCPSDRCNLWQGCLRKVPTCTSQRASPVHLAGSGGCATGTHRPEEVWPIHRGAKEFAGADAQDLFHILTYSVCCRGCQRQNGHLWELLLQHPQLLIVRPAPHKLALSCYSVAALLCFVLSLSAAYDPGSMGLQ